MKKTLYLILAIFTFILPTISCSAEYLSDIILTSPNGIWVDSRAFSSLQDAITAVGVSDREIVIALEESVVDLTIPSNVRLKFLRDGSINNSGQLTINTTNISADNRQIFTGSGDIDFTTGSVIKSSWFADIAEAFDITSDDTITLIISESYTISENTSIGNNINLKWEAPNIITISNGFTLSNINNIEAGNFQIFSGAGDFDFVDGTRLKSSWFIRLRSLITYVGSAEVEVEIAKTETIDFNTTSDENITLNITKGGSVSPDAGITFIINGAFKSGPYQSIEGAGTVILGTNATKIIYPQWTGQTGIPQLVDNPLLDMDIATKNYVDDEGNRLQIAIIGDSLSQAHILRDTWAWQFSRLVNQMGLLVNVKNWAVGGATFLSAYTDFTVHQSGTRSQVDQAIVQGADIVFVALGLNDALFSGQTSSQIINAAQDIYDDLHIGLPLAKIVYVETLPHNLDVGLIPLVMTNKDCIPWSHGLITYGGLSNCRVNSNTYYNTNSPKLSLHQTWGTASTSIRAIFDDYTTVNMWKIHKMGGRIDTIGHLDSFGHMVFAHTILRWFKDNNDVDNNILDIGLWASADSYLLDPDDLYTEAMDHFSGVYSAGKYNNFDIFSRMAGWFYGQRYWRPYVGPSISGNAGWPIDLAFEDCEPDAMIYVSWDGCNFVDTSQVTTEHGNFYQSFSFSEVMPTWDFSAGTKQIAYALKLSDGTCDVYTTSMTFLEDPHQYIFGPVSSTDNGIVLFNGTTGGEVKDSTRSIEDTLSDGSNLPDGHAIKIYGDANWSAGSGDVIGPAANTIYHVPQWNGTPDSKTLIDGFDISDQGKDLVDDLTAAAQRSTLGLGTAATRTAEDSMTDGSNLPDGHAIKTYGDTNWSGGGSGETITVVAMGQSNMMGQDDGDDRGTDTRVTAWNGASWVTADLANAPFNTHNNIAFHFAKQVAEKRNCNVRIILEAEDGRPISDWVPATGAHYVGMRGQITDSNTTEVDIILWHQGESDCGRTYAAYGADLNSLCIQLRSEAQISTTVPIIMGELVAGGIYSHQNYVYERITDYVSDTFVNVAKAKFLPSMGSFIHFDDQSLIDLGRMRYYTAMETITGMAPGHKGSATVIEVNDCADKINNANLECYDLLLEVANGNCRVKRAANQSVLHNNWTIIQFNSEDWDLGNNFSSYKFTATYAGYYQVNAQCMFNALSATSTVNLLSIFKNNVRTGIEDNRHGFSSEYLNMDIAGLIYLNVGDYITMKVFQYSGNTQTLVATGTGETKQWLSVKRVL